ncbi:MAG: DNA internalization-related competence protein ComEC/Rec2 [Burkholderiaceae bacterium]
MVPLLLGWVLGSALQLVQPELYKPSVYLLISAVAGVLIVFIAIKSIVNRKRRQVAKQPSNLWRLMVAGVFGVAVAALAFGLTGWRAVAYSSQTLQAALEGKDVQVVGIVAAMPQESDAGLRFRLEVESAHVWAQNDIDRDAAAATVDAAKVATLPVALPPLIDLSWYGGVFSGSNSAQKSTQKSTDSVIGDPAFELQRQPAHLLPGERWQMTVRLKAPHGNNNPDGFDYELYLWEQGVQATGYVRAGVRDALPRRLSNTWRHPIERLRLKVRDAVFARLGSQVPGEMSDTSMVRGHSRNAGVVAALVTGDQRAIDRADWDVFRATGVAHLMSISGLHITMFAWAAALLVGWLWRRSTRLCLAFPAPYAALIGGVLLATLYAAFSGWGVPSQRTVWMLATVGLLRLSGKHWPWPVVWLLACAVVVAFDPWALLQAGFWLSFVAVGVLFATDKPQPRSVIDLPNSPNNSPPRAGLRVAGGLQRVAKRVVNVLRSNTREQGVITLALTPLTLLLFGQVSVVGLLANVVAIPWVTFVVTPLAMLGTLYAPMWDMAAAAMQGLSVYLAYLASFSWATVSVATPTLFSSAMGVLGGLFLVMPWPWRLRMLGLPLLLPVVLWQAPRPEFGQFELLAADIGQGNAVIVRTAHHTLLYDAGPRFSLESDAGHRVLVPLLRSTGEKVDTVMLSHRDIDHSGGIKSVLTMHPNAQFISSIEDAHALHAVKRASRCYAGQQWQWDGVDFTVLHPGSPDYDASPKSNAMSCVLRISTSTSASMSTQVLGNPGSHQKSALLVGDIEQAQEARLVARQEDHPAKNSLQSTVLLVPHHGSKTSSSAAFLDAVKPDMAIVQAGYRNRFGHPAPPVMERYQERNIKTVDSAHCGAAAWSSANPQRIFCQRQQVKRYWHHQVP